MPGYVAAAAPAAPNRIAPTRVGESSISRSPRSRWLVLGRLWLILLTHGGCWRSSQQEVVVYSALDREFSQPIFDEFTRQTGIRVLAKYDTESTKTVGLANAIIAESRRPRCDVFWNNEVLHTCRLESRHLLRAYHSAASTGIPAAFRSDTDDWTGFAARARIFLVNDTLVTESERPSSIEDLADPRWRGKVGMAKPLFGTTATHAAVLFQVWPQPRAREFFRAVHKNASIEAGNKQVALSVSRGRLAWGLTDTDDAIMEIEKGMPVSIVYPDQQTNGMGTLFIPNTVSLVARSPHPKNAEVLVDYLLSEAIEARLAAGPSAQIPLRRELESAARVATPSTMKRLVVDFQQAAAAWGEVESFLEDEFVRVGE